ISGGRAFPVEITEKKEVKIDKESGVMSDEVGYLTLQEVIAKIGYTKKDEPQEENQEPINDDNAEDSESEEEKSESLLSGDDEPPQEEKKRGRKSNLS
ncbi:MAG: hypothetical protein NC094_12185, partial [Bacteroidales bacterium]|nr:hypothetical protein [Bacteroidales bacterium]